MRPDILLIAALPALVAAAPVAVRLAPPSAEVEMRAYAMGVVPIDSRFTRFEGRLTYDPADPRRCSATLTAQTASLETARATTREAMLGADFLDAARFPTFVFTGACTGAETLDGSLTLRGVTHPLALHLSRSAQTVIAEADVRRTVWNMVAKPLIVGPTIRIRITTQLP